VLNSKIHIQNVFKCSINTPYFRLRQSEHSFNKLVSIKKNHSEFYGTMYVILTKNMSNFRSCFIFIRKICIFVLSKQEQIYRQNIRN